LKKKEKLKYSQNRKCCTKYTVFSS